MKKIFFLTILISFFFLFQANFVLANSEDNHESEIEEGRELVESKVNCDELNDEQLEAIGEYLMEQMHPGESHEIMHKMMGMEEGTEYHKQFHVNMAQMMYCGKNTMMGSMEMMGNWSNPQTSNLFKSNNMMGNMMTNFGYWGWFGWIFMILFWILIIVGVIALIKWLISQGRSEHKARRSALDVLKERYAKGEIDKKEFEEKKKDLI